MPGNNAHSSATSAVHHTNTHISPMDGLTSITAGPKATASASGYYGLFLPPGLGASDDSYGASVVNVCGDVGTYAVRCMAGNDPTGGIERCGPGAPVMTVTEGTKEFNFATTSMSDGTTTVIQQSCHITAGTAAECTAKTEWSGNTKSSTAKVAKFTDATEFRQQVFPVSFTAGLPKLKFSVNSVCKSSAQTTKPISVKLVGVAAMLAVSAVFAL